MTAENLKEGKGMWARLSPRVVFRSEDESHQFEAMTIFLITQDFVEKYPVADAVSLRSQLGGYRVPPKEFLAEEIMRKQAWLKEREARIEPRFATTTVRAIELLREIFELKEEGTVAQN